MALRAVSMRLLHLGGHWRQISTRPVSTVGGQAFLPVESSHLSAPIFLPTHPRGISSTDATAGASLAPALSTRSAGR